ncbi:uncharacterized protein [Eurosta solidaginis]|uniref:uncharacterized protein n=1 Tax=Eurosta solidaginis TaxID=178769 RepID=UPI00353070D3
MWRKAFSDQRYQAKKLSFYKQSKKKTGGGPYQEKTITATEEAIIEAAGLEVCVAGDENVIAYGRARATLTSSKNSESYSASSDDESLSCLPGSSTAPPAAIVDRTPRSKTPGKKSSSEQKMALLQENLKTVSDFQRGLDEKLDRLLDVQERFLLVQQCILQIKEEKYRRQKEASQIDLQIKRLELETLQIKARRPD